MATASDPDRLRAELDEIGERRAKHNAEAKALVRDTGKAIRRARRVLSMTEIAKRVRLERTSMYHTYGRE